MSFWNPLRVDSVADEAAATFLANAKAAYDPEADRQDAADLARSMGRTEEERAQMEAEAVRNRFLWLETMLAGVAEARLPRNYLDYLVPVF